MRILNGKEAIDAEAWMMRAADTATHALCTRAKCGSVIVKNGEVIGAGYNAPPLDAECNRMCNATHMNGKPKYDATCCMHAEWRAILDAQKCNPHKIQGASLYFVRVDEAGAIKRSGKPYCTVCSRLALDAGIATFALWHNEGIGEYPTVEYNTLSYEYRHEADK